MVVFDLLEFIWIVVLKMHGVLKTLPLIVKRQAEKPRKQRITSIGEFKISSRCSNCNCKGHNSN